MSSIAIPTTKTQQTKRQPFYQRLSFEETFWGWAFALPAVLGLILFKLGPVLASLLLSFTKYDIISAPQWTGLTNYNKLLGDDLWLTSVGVTLRYVGLFVPSALITA
ncbi:MAG: sugar ABC transporter permease, partial [Caldilineaceae bacterium]|nr:sugar ABC transporter permease [Caldilineaceae bacterium]